MMNNNKILTVSYGTFSCTLEGFDDSFGTMKAIAEYFRDLAADDRYFGAEPPQPDAEMLARIAQKEISRRVEAREDEGRIVLSAQESVEPPAPVAVAAVAGVSVQDTAAPDSKAVDASENPPSDAADKADAPAAPEVVEEPKATSEPEVAVSVEQAEAPYIAETLAETGEDASSTFVGADTVSEPAEEPVVDSEVTDNDVTVAEEENAAATDTEEEVLEQPVAAEVIATPEVDTAEPEEADAPVVVVAEETEAQTADVLEDESAEDAAEAFFANSATAVEEDADEEALYAEMATPQEHMPVAEDVSAEAPAIPESIADKLKRIRAVVSQGPVAAPEEAEYDAEEGTPAEANDAFLSDFMATSDADETLNDAPETADTVAEAAADIETAFEADDAVLETSAAQQYDDDEEAFVQDISTALERFDAVANDRSGIAEASGTNDEATEEAIDLAGYEIGDAEEETDSDFEDLTAEVNEEDEIEDVLDNLFEKEYSAKDALKDEEDETDALIAASTDETQTSAPDARLMKVPSSDIEDAFEQYAEDAETHADASDVSETEQENKRSALDSLPTLGDGQDTDVSRLMAEADSQMQEPESAGRRKAFAHLRAAVAAKKADKAMGTDVPSEASDQAYRSDLADAVKPRRPVVGKSTRTERPTNDATAAPLKLVAEQRVDVQRPDGPVRPRRIEATQEERIADAAGESFNAFADEMGATKLPDLLEAAAAYLSFVEGHDQFSRPQLMTKVRQVENEAFNREDSLRSFGQLLRDGKIQKIKGGRFKVSEDIGFKPDERAAG